MKNSNRRAKTAFAAAFLAALMIAGNVGLLAAPKKSAKVKSQTSSAAAAAVSADNPVVFQIGTEKFTYDDVNKVCLRNSSGKRSLKSMSCDSMKQFIELYYTYQLKLKDAESRGYEKDPAVKHELENNRKIVAENYFFDKFVATPNINKMVERRAEEKQISYMLFSFPPAPAKDTMDTYRRASSTLKKLQMGEDFAVLASQYSDDKSTAKNGGVLDDWVTSGKMDRRMENAIYKLTPGQYYPELVKLPKFGYFIIKLDNTKKRSFIKFSHILFSQSSTSDSLALIPKAKADSVFNLIASGQYTYDEAAKKFSDDNATAVNGGKFDDWYSRSDGFLKEGGKVVPVFEDAVFRLDPGEYSKPIRTMYGWHIIRCDSVRPVNFTEETESVRNLYRRIFYENDKREFLDSVKIAMGYKLNENTLDELVSSVDTNKTDLDSTWDAKISPSLYQKTLFSMSGQNYKVKEITDLMNKPGEFRGLPTNPEGFERAIQLFTDPKALNAQTANLENEYPDFKDLIKDFRDGTLIFKAENDEVWNNTPFDSAAALKYYNDNKSKFYTDTLYDVQEVLLIKESEAQDMYNNLKAGKLTFDEAAEKYTQRSGYREIKGKLFEVNPKKHKIAEIVRNLKVKEGDFTTPQKSDIGYSIIKVNAIHFPKQKTFKESFGDIAPLIQDMTHKSKSEKWITRLKKKYNLTVYDNTINGLCK